jgi:hypothetical protein
LGLRQKEKIGGNGQNFINVTDYRGYEKSDFGTGVKVSPLGAGVVSDNASRVKNSFKVNLGSGFVAKNKSVESVAGAKKILLSPISRVNLKDPNQGKDVRTFNTSFKNRNEKTLKKTEETANFQGLYYKNIGSGQSRANANKKNDNLLGRRNNIDTSSISETLPLPIHKNGDNSENLHPSSLEKNIKQVSTKFEANENSTSKRSQNFARLESRSSAKFKSFDLQGPSREC